MIPWTLIFTLAQEAAPEIIPDVKRLYANWKNNRTNPTQADWDALLGRVTDNSLRKTIEAAAEKVV